MAHPDAAPRNSAGKGMTRAEAPRDLFHLDSPLTGEIRSERSLMAFPFFALSKNAWMKPLHYHHGPVTIEVRLCDWLYRSILRDRQVLDYAMAYFQLGPVERRIYEVARSCCEDGRFEIDLATFRLQVGYQNPLPNFRAAMKAIAGTDSIPDYDVALVEDEAPAESSARGRRATPVRVVLTRRKPALARRKAAGGAGTTKGG